MILCCTLAAQRLEVAGWIHLRAGAGAGRGQGDAGTGEDIEAEVAAAFGPLVVLFCWDGADEADQGIAAGKIPTTSVRRRISRFSRSIVIWSPVARQVCDLGCCVEDIVLDAAA